MSLLKRLCELNGIHTEWRGIDGSHNPVSESVLKSVLSILDVSCDNEEVMEKEVKRLEEYYWKKPLKDVYVIRKGDASHIGPIEIVVERDLWDIEQNLYINFEKGGQYIHKFIPSQEKCLEWREVGGRHLARLEIYLSNIIPLGYHRIKYQYKKGKVAFQFERSFIVAPVSSYTPDDFHRQKYWGIGAHLYSLKGSGHPTNGDFSDLKDLINLAKQSGAQFVGINPLTALYPHYPKEASPYSPSSRSFLNPIYIETASQQQNVGHDEWIDYEKSYKERFAILRNRFENFIALEDDHEDRMAFRQWVGEDEERLILFGIYHVLADYLQEYNPKKWPLEYQDPKSTEAEEIAKKYAKDVTFHIWMQWIADYQLSKIGKKAKDELGIGLYGDLAVGVTAFGVESWSQDVIVSNVSFGAPPDQFSAMGQNWSISPFNPQKLRQEGFESFIHMVRKNMRHCGALRIDHIIGLRQLYWIIDGMNATEGVYVSNPYQEFLGIIALESHRNKCIVIGEDLGNVPWGMREEMERENMLGYRVFWFETWESGLFKRPDAYSPKALASISTHDLPTIYGYWQGRDLAIRRKVGDYPSLEAQEALEQKREQEKQNLLAALIDQNLISADVTIETVNMEELVKALHIFIARSESQMMMVQIDDLSYEQDPLNMPGLTQSQYPSWRRRLSHTTQEYMQSDNVKDILKAVHMAREQKHA